jgi:hypothetical protein
MAMGVTRPAMSDKATTGRSIARFIDEARSVS